MSKIKSNVWITISGTPGSGKSTIHKILQVWMEKNGGYSIKAINGQDREDPTLIFEDNFHRLIIQTQQEEKP